MSSRKDEYIISCIIFYNMYWSCIPSRTYVDHDVNLWIHEDGYLRQEQQVRDWLRPRHNKGAKKFGVQVNFNKEGLIVTIYLKT